jgi:hypothetical protein
LGKWQQSNKGLVDFEHMATFQQGAGGFCAHGNIATWGWWILVLGECG